MQPIRFSETSVNKYRSDSTYELRSLLPLLSKLNSSKMHETLALLWVVRKAYEDAIMPVLHDVGLKRNRLEPVAQELEQDLSYLGYNLSSVSLEEAEKLQRIWSQRPAVHCAFAAEKFLLLETDIFNEAFWLEIEYGYRYRYRTKSIEFRNDIYLERMIFFETLLDITEAPKLLTNVLCCYADIKSLLDKRQAMTVEAPSDFSIPPIDKITWI